MNDDNHLSSPLNPAALAPDVAARVLSASGRKRVTTEQIEADIAAGAPRNADGTINLVEYASWLVKEMSRRAD